MTELAGLPVHGISLHAAQYMFATLHIIIAWMADWSKAADLSSVILVSDRVRFFLKRSMANLNWIVSL